MELPSEQPRRAGLLLLLGIIWLLSGCSEKSEALTAYDACTRYEARINECREAVGLVSLEDTGSGQSPNDCASYRGAAPETDTVYSAYYSCLLDEVNAACRQGEWNASGEAYQSCGQQHLGIDR